MLQYPSHHEKSIGFFNLIESTVDRILIGDFLYIPKVNCQNHILVRLSIISRITLCMKRNFVPLHSEKNKSKNIPVCQNTF